MKIFSDKKWLPHGVNHVIMLYPFWGDIALPDTDPDKSRFDDYISKGKDVFEITSSIKECDVVVLPFEYDFSKASQAESIAKEAKAAGKKLIVFFNNDSTQEIKLDNAVIFRTSFFKSKQKSNEVAFPGWSTDFKKYVPGMVPISKKDQPEVSYCGYVDSLEEPQQSLAGKIRTALVGDNKESLDHGSKVRGKMVRRLLSDKRIKNNFIIRDGFWAQGITDKHKVRKEYAENIFASPYALVTRGAGNFSYRLLEVMSCGRIPVFVNTDAVLPMENKINWKKQTVWVEEKDINKLNDIIFDFHKNMSDDGLIDLQKQNRNLYERYLSPVAYFSHINEFVK